MQHAARGGRLAAVDHAAAGLNRQIAFEGEIGALEKRFIVAPAKAEIFDLNHYDRNIVVVKIETADVFVRDAGHFERALAGLSDSGNQWIGAIARPAARVVALAPAEQID